MIHTQQIVNLWASESDKEFLTLEGKYMHEELRQDPLPIEKFHVKGTLEWVFNQKDDLTLYSGQMKDGKREGLGRL